MSETIDQPVYFIGIALPEMLNQQISQLQWQFYERNKRLQKPLLPHVTLLHPPSLQGIMPDELLPQVREVAERYLPLTLACQEVKLFGKNVCYIEIESYGLYSLQSQLVKLLPLEAQEIHYKRPYLPHITLAQSYEPHELDTESLERETTAKLELPLQFEVDSDSVAYFRRILPRQYRAETL